MEERLKGQGKVDTSDLVSLCLGYSKTKRYNKLFPCLDRLELNIQQGDRKHVKGNVFLGMYTSEVSSMPHLLRAEAYLELQDYDRALKEAKKGLAAIPSGIIAENYYSSQEAMFPAKKQRVQALATLAMIHAFRGDRASAEKYRQQIEVSTARATFGWHRRDALLRVDMALGNYPAVVERMESFGVAAEKTMRTWYPPAMLATLFSEGSLTDEKTSLAHVMLPMNFMYRKALFETGNIAKAKEGYDYLLSLEKSRENGDIYWLMLYDRGRIAERENQRAQAIGYFRKSIDVIESQRASINTEASKIGFVGNKQDAYRALVAVLFADGQYAAAFEYIERAKARALVDMLASKKDFAVHATNADDVRTLLASANTAELNARVQDASPETVRQRTLAIQSHQQLQQQAPELASLVTVTPVTVSDLQSQLSASEVLVEYYAAGKELYAFVLSKEGLQGIRLDGEGLAADVQQFRKALQDARSTHHSQLARQLYDRLFKPLEGVIVQRNVLLVAHGPLHYLPFNALHDGQGYVIERYSLRHLPSASVLKYLRKTQPQTTGTLLAFGNPDLGDPQQDLRHAETEAQTVAQVLPGSRALVRREASESAFRRYGGGFRYLHIASHGVFNAAAPMNSALLLAKDSQNDGSLTVGELYSLRLNADLVTLSACETGLGQIANGDDVVGLTRGFLYAGTRSIIASLWKVDDEATAYLMTRLYTGLKDTSKREALRLAQIETRKKYPHPFYWAAFQLTGEGE